MTDELRRLNIEITSRCNYACVGCPTHELLRGKGTMNIDLYKAIFDEVGDKLDRVFLWGYGEPLLHPQIAELVRYARRFPTKKVMSTTGWRLEDIADLESLGQLDELIISINGLTPRVYSMHQVNGDLEKVLRGVEKVAPIMRNSKTMIDYLPFFREMLIKSYDIPLGERSVIHGDYHPGNVLFEKDRLVGIIDFDSVRMDSRIKDISIMIDRTPIQCDDFQDKQAIFLYEYNSLYPLTKEEGALIAPALIKENCILFPWLYGGEYKNRDTMYGLLKQVVRKTHKLAKQTKWI